jgi:hypothetical protein
MIKEEGKEGREGGLTCAWSSSTDFEDKYSQPCKGYLHRNPRPRSVRQLRAHR